MSPADQRLERDDAIRLKVDDRLVVQHELVPGQRAAQVHLQVEERHGRRVGAAVVDGVVSLPPGLRLVHRQVGVVEKLFRLRLGRGAQRDADAAGDEDVTPVHDERLFEVRRDALGHVRGAGHAREPFQHDAELVAAEPRHGVLRAHAVPEPPADLDEDLVADDVPQAVVDHLEAVEIEEQHSQGVGPSLRPDHRVAQAVDEQRAIRQFRQRIPEGLAGQLVQPGRHAPKLLRLLLDGRRHPRERREQGADVIAAIRHQRGIDALGRGDEPCRPRDRGRYVPDDDAAA